MTQKADIFNAFKEKGPMTEAQVREACPNIKRTSIKARLWDLRCQGYLAMGEDGVYQITSDHDPEGPEAEELSRRNLSSLGTNGKNGRSEPWDDDAALTGDQDKFRELLKDCSVTKGIDPIVEMFFSGDPEDLENLVQVLEDARAYVQPLQKRMIVRYWARFTQHWPLPNTLEERLNQDGGRGSAADYKSTGSEFMEDLGWKVEKDRDGEWIPRPSGDLTYSQALKWCATMNASRPMVTEREEDPEEETPTRGRKRGRQEDSMMGKLLDRAFPDRDERDERIQALERRLEESDRARQDDRMDRIEAMIAAQANRNHVRELLEFQTQLQAAGLLGGGPQQHVTDTSPTVQLVKDQSDKLDKNMNRALGILERVALRDHNTLAPEETSTSPQEQEARAAELLGKMRQGTRSKALRTQLWGQKGTSDA